MKDRKKILLQLVVEQHIATAEPVGSKVLSECKVLHVSGATIRNELRELEEAGFLTQPYTSAGRIPTEEGYRYYVRHLMRIQQPGKKVINGIKQLQGKATGIDKYKALAQFIAEVSDLAVIMQLNRDHVYYTGISALLAQPEFTDRDTTLNISAMFDACEDRMRFVKQALEHDTADDATIFIGEHNPLGGSGSLIATKLHADAILSVLGPQRMNYAQLQGLFIYIHNALHA